MDGSSLFNLVAGLASIGGAIISFWQANKSETAAKLAENIKSQLITNKKNSEISGLMTACDNVIRTMQKYGPGSVPSSLLGITPSTDAQEVQNFYASIKRNRGLFSNNVPNEADLFCAKLLPDLENFSKANDEAGLKKNGTKIYINLTDLSSIIKTIVDNKIESTTKIE